jgi:hypothetical protein
LLSAPRADLLPLPSPGATLWRYSLAVCRCPARGPVLPACAENPVGPVPWEPRAVPGSWSLAACPTTLGRTVAPPAPSALMASVPCAHPLSAPTRLLGLLERESVPAPRGSVNLEELSGPTPLWPRAFVLLGLQPGLPPEPASRFHIRLRLDPPQELQFTSYVRNAPMLKAGSACSAALLDGVIPRRGAPGRRPESGDLRESAGGLGGTHPGPDSGHAPRAPAALCSSSLADILLDLLGPNRAGIARLRWAERRIDQPVRPRAGQGTFP